MGVVVLLAFRWLHKLRSLNKVRLYIYIYCFDFFLNQNTLSYTCFVHCCVYFTQCLHHVFRRIKAQPYCIKYTVKTGYKPIKEEIICFGGVIIYLFILFFACYDCSTVVNIIIYIYCFFSCFSFFPLRP